MVGSTFGPCSAPSTIDSATITSATISVIVESFSTAYGKNGLPFFFSDLVVAEVGLLLGPVHPTSSLRTADLG